MTSAFFYSVTPMNQIQPVIVEVDSKKRKVKEESEPVEEQTWSLLVVTSSFEGFVGTFFHWINDKMTSAVEDLKQINGKSSNEIEIPKTLESVLPENVFAEEYSHAKQEGKCVSRVYDYAFDE